MEEPDEGEGGAAEEREAPPVVPGVLPRGGEPRGRGREEEEEEEDERGRVGARDGVAAVDEGVGDEEEDDEGADGDHLEDYF